MPRRHGEMWLVTILMLAGCVTGPGDASKSATSTTLPNSTSSPTTLSSPVEHRIGVRTVDGAGEFFDRRGGERFVPRGANLIRLSAGNHSTLDPGHYDPGRIDAAFGRMAGGRYNVVRIFLNSRPGGMPGDGEPLSAAYLDNAVDVLRRARAHGLQILFTQDWLPESSSWSFASDPLIDNVNSMYLSRGGLETNQRFFREWALGLISRSAPFDALLAYELRNELYFTEIFPPFSLSSGAVSTANGETYDLGSESERRTLLEENLIFWIDRMREAILEVDRTALVTVGFFQPKGPNTSRVGDDRLIETKEAILRSTADFIDLHGYPGGELGLGHIVENFGLPAMTEKPILLGEFGAEHGPYPSAEDGVRALVEWQVESCLYGFDGWLLWTWDSVEQPEFWNALDDDGAIERALAPTTRPDPCAVGDLGLPFELARHASALASQAAGDSPAANAIDGLPDTIWNAGDDAPQWIEVDLGAEQTIETIRLLVAQYPAGPTTHVITVRGDDGVKRSVAVLAQSSGDGDWLEVSLPVPLGGVRSVRVETTESPSWAAWREISILGRPGA